MLWALICLVLSLVLMTLGILLILNGRGAYENWDQIQRPSLSLVPFLLDQWEASRGGPFDSADGLMTALFWAGASLLVGLIVRFLTLIRW
ncbi:hypothetical protein [Nocardiopsis lucentensis]|uniref:hypothetical protein n=1 Tax=Nocardiopsis lucentensis TaxID=53441 RepID=UPI00034C55FF|nr:hypothetical protein [Nocardiopsis lucentensis]